MREDTRIVLDMTIYSIKNVNARAMNRKRCEEMRKPKDKKLCKAVENFAAAMLDRLAEKEAQGYDGWDNENIVPVDELVEALIEDAKDIRVLSRRQRQSWQPYTYEVIKKLAIDIANRSMMIVYRVQGIS
jgi:hypothetical protein